MWITLLLDRKFITIFYSTTPPIYLTFLFLINDIKLLGVFEVRQEPLLMTR